MERVILGMPGPWATDFYEASDHYTTKIGGLPDWPIPREDIKPDLLQCAVCRGYLSLVAQVYAPLESGTLKVEERVIYVLGCPSPKCGSNSLSWRTLRFQKFSTMVESSESNYANSQSGQVVLSSASQKVAEFPASSGPVLTNDDWWEEDSWTHGYGEDLDHERNGVFSLQELGRAFSEAARQISRTGKQNGRAHHASVEDYSSKPSMRVIDASIPGACSRVYGLRSWGLLRVIAFQQGFIFYEVVPHQSH